MAFFGRFGARHLVKRDASAIEKADGVPAGVGNGAVGTNQTTWGPGKGYQDQDQQAHDEAMQGRSQALDMADQLRNGVSSNLMQLKDMAKQLDACLAQAGTMSGAANQVRSNYGDDPDEDDRAQAAQAVIDAIGKFVETVHPHLK